MPGSAGAQNPPNMGGPAPTPTNSTPPHATPYVPTPGDHNPTQPQAGQAGASPTSPHPHYPAGPPSANDPAQRPALLRSPRQELPGRPAALLAGVCSGLSVHTGMSVVAVRIAMVGLTAVFAAGALLYLWLWILVPEVGSERTYGRGRIAPSQKIAGRQALTRTQRIVYGALALAAISFILAIGVLMQPDLGYNTLGIVVIIVGVVIIWTQSARASQWRDPRVIGLAATGVGILFWGIVIVIGSDNGGLRQMMTSFTAGITFVAVLALAFFPAWNNLIKDLTSTRIERARETERADIAAHLHDSVLQTLTLIKNHAREPGTVRALALTQERELRAWLYTGKNTVSQSFTELLKTTLSEVEATFGQEVEVVSVSDCVPGPAEQAACAAASEACVNAIKHGQPPIQVYSEVGSAQVKIYIKDRGPGFDPQQIATDRHGVRDSIIGRVERVGGSVNIRRLQPGTEITITVPRTPFDLPAPR